LVQKVPCSMPNGLGQLRPPFFVAQQHPDRVDNAITYLPCQCYHLPTYAFSRAEHQSIYLPKQQVPPLSVPLYRVISPLRALINKLTINLRYLPLQQSKAICATLLLPTSPPGDRWIPHPRLLLRRLGGWGIPDSRCVYSVGLEGRPAGGVVEAVARPEWPFAAEPVPSGGGALRGAATRRPPSPSLQVPGSRRRGVSSLDLAWRRIWKDLEFREEACRLVHRGGVGGSGCPFFGSPATSQLQRSCLPSMASSGAGAVARHRAAVVGEAGI
jgi:hypothetical protein